MAIEIGTVNADTSVKLGTTVINTGYIGFNKFFGNEIPILDIFPTAHHAFSLRKLRSAYTGACLRIRRTTTTPSVTTTTVDLSFDSNNTISLNSTITYVSGTATTATNLGQFCASIVNGYTNPDGVNTNQNIFVVTWFDQSGNGKNVTQATAGNQPRIVATGVLEVKNSKPAIRFLSASSTNLFLTDTSMNINNLSQYIVTALITINAFSLTSAFRALSNTWWLPASSTSTTYINYNGTSSITSGFVSQVNDIVNRVYSIVAGSGTATAYKNTTSIGTKATISLVSEHIALGWSGNASAPNYVNGYIQESITFQNQSNVTNIQSNIIRYYGL